MIGTIQITSEDELYALSDALDTFLKDCDQKLWRAVEAAQALNAQVNSLREQLRTT